MRGHVLCRGFLALHHVRIEIRRTPHGLTGIVDDEVQALTRRQQLLTERLDTRRVAQVQAEDFQPTAPVPEIRLRRIARGRVTRETRSDDEARASTQQLQTRLVADLD